MQRGHVWQSVCAHCGKRASWDELWQEEKPTSVAPHLKSCCDAVALNEAAPIADWEHAFFNPPGLDGRISGFSTSESDFVPHFNRAFGQRVNSLAEMKALQAQHGASDVVVKGDGADRHAPRDIVRRWKHHRDFSEQVNEGKPIDVGHGVRVEFTEPGEDQ